MEETTYFDAEKGISSRTSAKYGPRLKFVGTSQNMHYISTATFAIDNDQPEIGSAEHFVGTATFGDGELSVKLHLSSPPGDSFWYVTLKETIKKDNAGNNQTPVVAYTDCGNKLPWEEKNKCRWMVHEGPTVGWRSSSKVKLRVVN